MQMTNEEICRSYRQAKNRQYQIKILADENLCSVEEIRQILIDNGALVPKPPKKIGNFCSKSAGTESGIRSRSAGLESISEKRHGTHCRAETYP